MSIDKYKKHIHEILQLERHAIEADVSGVYFLFQGESIVYVGQSRNIHSRVRDHLADKQFEHYSFIEIELPSHRKAIEAHYIEILNPLLNVATPSAKKLEQKTKKLDEIHTKQQRIKKGNKALIDHLYRSHKASRTKKGFVYYKYIEKAPFYCITDLRYIAELLGYKKGWINHKQKELKELDKWKK